MPHKPAHCCCRCCTQCWSQQIQQTVACLWLTWCHGELHAWDARRWWHTCSGQACASRAAATLVPCRLRQAQPLLSACLKSNFIQPPLKGQQTCSPLRKVMGDSSSSDPVHFHSACTQLHATSHAAPVPCVPRFLLHWPMASLELHKQGPSATVQAMDMYAKSPCCAPLPSCARGPTAQVMAQHRQHLARNSLANCSRLPQGTQQVGADGMLQDGFPQHRQSWGAGIMRSLHAPATARMLHQWQS